MNGLILPRMYKETKPQISYNMITTAIILIIACVIAAILKLEISINNELYNISISVSITIPRHFNIEYWRSNKNA